MLLARVKPLLAVILLLGIAVPAWAGQVASLSGAVVNMQGFGEVSGYPGIGAGFALYSDSPYAPVGVVPAFGDILAEERFSTANWTLRPLNGAIPTPNTLALIMLGLFIARLHTTFRDRKTTPNKVQP